MNNLTDITNNISTGLIILNPKAEVLETNRASIKLLGIDLKETKSKDLEKSHPMLAKLLEQIKNSQINFVQNHKRLELHCNGQFLNLDINKVSESTIVIELHKANQKDFGTMTHELKRPLQNIKASAEALIMGAKDDPKHRDNFLENINLETDRLANLIDNILKLSSLESGSIELKKTKAKIKDMVEHTLQSFKNKIKDKKISVSNDIDTSFTAELDQDLFKHVLDNLIENGIKYNKESGSLKISNNGDKEIIIEDTGLGISADDLEHIFDQFFRAKTTSNTNGSGIGLSIVKSIIDLHQGKLTVESEPGRGSKFKIQL